MRQQHELEIQNWEAGVQEDTFGLTLALPAPASFFTFGLEVPPPVDSRFAFAPPSGAFALGGWGFGGAGETGSFLTAGSFCTPYLSCKHPL